MTDRSVVVRLRAEIGDFRRQMDDAARATDKIPASVARADTALGRMVQSARYNREAWDRAGRTMTAFGTVTLAGLGLASKAAIDWESQWTGVLKTVDGTDAQLGSLEQTLRQMARTLPASHQEIAAVAEAAGQLGVQTENVAAFTRTMIDLGETTNLSAQQAATGLARFANVMGTSQRDFGRLGSVLVGLGNNFATTESEILDMAQRLSSAGRVVGLTEADVLALAAAMSSVGIEAEAGGSAISRVMIKISSAVDAGGSDLQEFARAANMSASDFAQKWRTTPVDALLAVVGGLARMTETGQGTFSMLDELGLKDIRVTNAMLSLSNATDLTSRAVEMSSEEWAKNSALLLEAQKRYETAQARIDIAKGSINDAAITLGEVFLPAIADAADGVADFASWVGSLPQPVQQAAGGIGALAGTLGLAGGAFLLLFPRVMDTVKAFRNLDAGAKSTWTTIGKTAGILAAAAALIAIADAAQTASVSSDELLNRLVAIEQGGVGVDELFRDIGQGWAEDMWNVRFDVENVEEFRFALERLQAGADQGPAGVWGDLIGNDGGLRQLGKRLDDVGKALSTVAMQDGPRATAMFNQLVEAAGGGEDAVRLLLDAMPDYRDALYQAATAQGIALDETTLLAAATGELDITGQSATDALARMAAQTEQVSEAEAEATEALEEWRAMVAAADAQFLDLTGAYQSVIDANTAYAQSTADATKSTSDSWEDYYDGVSVSATDYIAELEAQVAAQEAWEQNMITLTERAGQGMTVEMQRAANAMIDELLELGPDGAAQVQLLASMTDEELAQVVTLWSQKGGQAVEEFTTQVENYRQPVITPYPNLTPAEDVIRQWLDQPRQIKVTTSVSTGKGNKIALAYGGEIPGPFVGPRADNVLIAATPGEYMHQVPAVNYWGRDFMDAVNRMDKAAVASSVAGYAYGGQVGVPVYVGGGSSASTTSAAPSLAGLAIEGTLDLGGGLVGVMRGVVRSELSEVGARAQYAGRP